MVEMEAVRPKGVATHNCCADVPIDLDILLRKAQIEHITDSRHLPMCLDSCIVCCAFIIRGGGKGSIGQGLLFGLIKGRNTIRINN